MLLSRKKHPLLNGSQVVDEDGHPLLVKGLKVLDLIGGLPNQVVGLVHPLTP